MSKNASRVSRQLVRDVRGWPPVISAVSSLKHAGLSHCSHKQRTDGIRTDTKRSLGRCAAFRKFRTVCPIGDLEWVALRLSTTCLDAPVKKPLWLTIQHPCEALTSPKKAIYPELYQIYRLQWRIFFQ